MNPTRVFILKNDTNFNGKENCEKCRFVGKERKRRKKQFNELEHAME